MLEIVAVIIDVPDVGHVLLLQISMDALANADEAVCVAAGDPQGPYGLVDVRFIDGPRIMLPNPRHHTSDICIHG